MALVESHTGSLFMVSRANSRVAWVPEVRLLLEQEPDSLEDSCWRTLSMVVTMAAEDTEAAEEAVVMASWQTLEWVTVVVVTFKCCWLEQVVLAAFGQCIDPHLGRDPWYQVNETEGDRKDSWSNRLVSTAHPARACTFHLLQRES
mmetsp:Transcript_27/g.30  ORF Transcript_27/g.30 Transcript_27/m.30 type:complete len:146 (+) Transcript_27:537-974(+)